MQFRFLNCRRLPSTNSCIQVSSSSVKPADGTEAGPATLLQSACSTLGAEALVPRMPESLHARSLHGQNLAARRDTVLEIFGKRKLQSISTTIKVVIS